MERKNTIGIIGRIKTPPKLIVDAADWARKVYETTLTRTRPSKVEDTYILQFDGRAAGSEEMIGKLTEGAEVIVGGEIRSENIFEPKPEENRVRVYIYAEIITINEPSVNDQNEVKICGNVCKPPRFKRARRRTAKGKRMAVANLIVAVNSLSGTNYIPCVFFGWQAFTANALKVGDYVEIYGRFQSRDYKKRIEGRKLPYLCTVHEVSAIKLISGSTKDRKKELGKRGD